MKLLSTWFILNGTEVLRFVSRSIPRAREKRIEYRCPDSSCNPYLAFFLAMLLAGLDGINNKIDLGAPIDKDIYGARA